MHGIHRGVKWPGPGVDYKPGLHYNGGEKQQGPHIKSQQTKQNAEEYPTCALKEALCIEDLLFEMIYN